ncbi:MAG: AAA family ATPase, partial [Candidatus Paceibacteria bacterium]
MSVTDVLSSSPFKSMDNTTEFTLLPHTSENLFLNPKYQSHGVQRAVFFALLELYITVVPSSHPDIGVQNMFLIEDPEMYMDPQMEAHISDLLFSLAYDDNIPVISTTHSAVFVRALENPRSLVRLFRTSEGDLTA